MLIMTEFLSFPRRRTDETGPVLCRTISGSTWEEPDNRSKKNVGHIKSKSKIKRGEKT